MKFFEYVYFGKKILSSPIEELMRKDLSDLIRIGSNAREWEEHINYLLKIEINKIKEMKQKQFAINNSWREKIEHISAFIG